MGAAWQRWTIDELGDDVARVLVADGETLLESSAAESQAAVEAGEADLDPLREAVAQVELTQPDLLWGEERANLVASGPLQEFLRLRARIRGLPEPRPLREGDVFWVVLPLDLDQAAVEGLTPAELIASSDLVEPQVWDVTAAARQAARRATDDALRAASPEVPG